jgi:hypothetical protein
LLVRLVCRCARPQASCCRRARPKERSGQAAKAKMEVRCDQPSQAGKQYRSLLTRQGRCWLAALRSSTSRPSACRPNAPCCCRLPRRRAGGLNAAAFSLVMLTDPCVMLAASMLLCARWALCFVALHSGGEAGSWRYRRPHSPRTTECPASSFCSSMFGS